MSDKRYRLPVEELHAIPRFAWFCSHSRCDYVAAPGLRAVSGAIVASELPTLLGADPASGRVPNARSYYRGYLQWAQLQLWAPHGGQELN